MKIILAIFAILILFSIFNIQNLQNKEITFSVAGYQLFKAKFLDVAVATIVTVTALVIVAGVKVLDSGLSETSVTLLFKAGGFLVPFSFLLITSARTFSIIPYGSIFQAFMILVFLGSMADNLRSA